MTQSLCFIKVYVSLRNREVLEYSPFVDQVEVWDWSLEFIRKVRKEKFDLMIAFSPITESYLAAFLSGSRIRAGYLYSSRPLTRFLSLFWLNKRLVCRIDQKNLEKAPSFVPHLKFCALNLYHLFEKQRSEPSMDSTSGCGS